MKYVVKTCCGYAGTEETHEIEGDFNSIEEATEAFGGAKAVWLQAIEDHSPEAWVEQLEEEDC